VQDEKGYVEMARQRREGEFSEQDEKGWKFVELDKKGGCGQYGKGESSIV
jgi:hypothetical protein